MIAFYNVYLAGGGFPEAGGLLDQDWEVTRAFVEVLAPRFGGVPEAIARRKAGL